MSKHLSEDVGVPAEQLLEQIRHIVQHLFNLDVVEAPSEKGTLYTHTTKTMRIAFERHYVLIHTNTQAIIEGLQATFSAMCVVEEHAEQAGQLGVYDMGKGFTVSGTRSMHVHEGSQEEALRALKHEIVLKFIEARPDLLWLHAGAAADQKGVLLLAGSWGSGKSTLVTGLCELGWRYLSDDIVPFDPTSATLRPFPLTPARRIPKSKVLPRHRICPAGKRAHPSE